MSDPNTDIQQKICDYIATELLASGNTVSPDEDLLMTGQVDSMGMMWLLSFIEETLGIAVPPQDVTLQNFRSVASMTRYLSTREEQI